MNHKESMPDNQQQPILLDHGMRICSECQQIVLQAQTEDHRRTHSDTAKITFSILLFREGE